MAVNWGTSKLRTSATRERCAAHAAWCGAANETGTACCLTMPCRSSSGVLMLCCGPGRRQLLTSALQQLLATARLHAAQVCLVPAPHAYCIATAARHHSLAVCHCCAADHGCSPMLLCTDRASCLPLQLAEFRVSPDGLLPVGTELTAAHFTPGQFVDIAGISSGKGFQGVMKRHGFAGQPASHGNSLAHRWALICSCPSASAIRPAVASSIAAAYLYLHPLSKRVKGTPCIG